jgi:hypothetical protein
MDFFGRIANPELLAARQDLTQKKRRFIENNGVRAACKKSLTTSARCSIIVRGLASQNHEGGCIFSNARTPGAAISSPWSAPIRQCNSFRGD